MSVCFIVALFVWLAGKDNSPTQVTPKTPLVTPLPTAFPTGNKLNFSGIETSNFYKTAPKIDKSGDVYIKNDPSTYQILYVSKFDQFLISILSSPFETVRLEAEQSFINSLEITEQEACSLNVSITTPSFVNSDESGKSYKLSFCE